MSLNDEYHHAIDEHIKCLSRTVKYLDNNCIAKPPIPPVPPMPQKQVNDAELIALAALASIEAVQMAGMNAYRALAGSSPAYTDGMMMEAGQKLYDELKKRGVL